MVVEKSLRHLARDIAERLLLRVAIQSLCDHVHLLYEAQLAKCEPIIVKAYENVSCSCELCESSTSASSAAHRSVNQPLRN